MCKSFLVFSGVGVCGVSGWGTGLPGLRIRRCITLSVRTGWVSLSATRDRESTG